MLMDMLSMFDGSSVHVDGYVAGRGAICWAGTELLVSLEEQGGVLYCA